MPLPDRPLTALLIRIRNQTILFDCGEGTQITWRRNGWPFRPTGTILLSHLHADHVAGLPGILFNIAHAGRTEPVTIYGPPRTYEITRNLTSIVGWVPYDLRVVELDGDDEVRLAEDLTLRTQRLRHPVHCLGYALEIRRNPRFDPERAAARGIAMTDWKRLQRGEIVDGVHPADVTGPPRRGLKLALVTDTSAFADLIPFVAGSDLLVCESMYIDDAEAEKAAERGHMTTRQAARLAASANVGQLWLTHFSPSVQDPQDALALANEEFPHAVVGETGLSTTLRFRD